MEQKDILKQAAELFAKVGLLFAASDGEYSSSEREFIENYMAELKAGNIVDYNKVSDIRELLKYSYSIDSLMVETDEFLKAFTEIERSAILESFDTFILKVIGADSKIAPKEMNLYNLWKSHFNYD